MTASSKSLKTYEQMGWILLVFAVLHVLSILLEVNLFAENDTQVTLKVNPAVTALLSKEPVKQFEGSALYFTGNLVIKDFPWWKKILLSKEVTNAICFAILAVLILLIINILKQKKELHKKIGRYIFYAGLVFVGSSFISMAQSAWLKTIVLERTNGEFELAKNIDALLPNSMVAIILLIFSGIYTKAWQLKTEQDLTI